MSEPVGRASEEHVTTKTMKMMMTIHACFDLVLILIDIDIDIPRCQAGRWSRQVLC